jgi:hypothetical protein
VSLASPFVGVPWAMSVKELAIEGLSVFIEVLVVFKPFQNVPLECRCSAAPTLFIKMMWKSAVSHF